LKNKEDARKMASFRAVLDLYKKQKLDVHLNPIYSKMDLNEEIDMDRDDPEFFDQQ
jgi:hypothetical protein